MDGVVVPPGQGRKLITKAQEVTFKVTGAQGAFASCFEVVVPPGFDVGAHIHQNSQEFFYVLDGELDLFAFEPTTQNPARWQDWESPNGDRPLRAGPGSCMFVPPGCPHAFTNPTTTPTRMLFQSYPAPDHEHYFEEIVEIFSTGRTIDPHAIQQLRDRYDINQLTPLHHTPPTPLNSYRETERGA
ncbi:cupin domain-containing protein [Saccharopolyspora sp. 5N708]|uniref:cupin domain-containing protein n=1 Tax=Saccharopolyspora sp. 5N708 TaxID=3457424 RepID=UPI003FD6B78E